MKILVLCTGNSCRSQMAEGWLKHLSEGSLEVYSAGLEKHGVNPRAVQVMKEAGVDISGHTSNKLDDYLETEFDIIITVCNHAHENCPYFPGNAERIHHNFNDPAKAKGNEEEVLNEFRSVRDEIKFFSQEFIESKFPRK